jgi:pimeloyl-ACP methyl ester carboxylesterase
MYLEVLSRQPKSNPRPTPLLFVHGAYHGAWYWTNFLDYFADHSYAAYAPNLRGHGASEGRERLRWTRVGDYVQDVAQVAAGLPRPPVVIGHSSGGLLVQKYLETQPAAAGILLASLPPGGSLALWLRLVRQHPREVLRAVLRDSPHAYLNTPRLIRESFFSADCPDDIVNECWRRIEPDSALAILEMLGFGLHRRKRVTVPVLVMGAANDSAIRCAEVEATARAYGTQAVIVPGLAHHMMLDPGWPVVAERMLTWLDEHGL